MPFLTQSRPVGLQHNLNFTLPTLDFSRPEVHPERESWLNLNQLHLQPDNEREELLFSLEVSGDMPGEEIYWLQIETLLKNQTVWRGEIGVFYDETMRNLHFVGSIPLPGARFWFAEETGLYNLRLTLYRGTSLLDKAETFFGLRQLPTEKGGLFLLNRYNWDPAVEASRKTEVARKLEIA